MSEPGIRIFVDADLAQGGTVTLDRDQSHYLVNVMRRKPGDHLRLFNGRDGEWRGELVEAGKRQALVRLNGQLASQGSLPDLWLCFAPVKRARLDFIAQRATELGAARLVPIVTERTIVSRVKTGRLRANTIEAAEQCELTCLPEVAEPLALTDLLAEWPARRRLLFCDETGEGPPIREALAAAAEEKPAPWAVFIGPEGGFSPAEAEMLRRAEGSLPVSLGPRVMRADTAAIAALALWQAFLGDWDRKPRFSPPEEAP